MRVYNFAEERAARRPDSKPYYGPTAVNVTATGTGGCVMVEIKAGTTPVFRGTWAHEGAEAVATSLLKAAREARKQEGAR